MVAGLSSILIISSTVILISFFPRSPLTLFQDKKIPGFFETAIQLVLPKPGIASSALRPEISGTGSSICSEAVIRLYFELRDEGQAEASIVATVVGGVVVTISRPAVPRIAIPVATTQDTVRTHD
jgi:hypothetical protein